ELVERIDLNLLVEGGYGVGILALLPVGTAESIVGVLVVGIDFNLLVESGDGVVILAHPQISRSEDIPDVLVFGIDFGGAFKKLNRHGQIVIGHGRSTAFDQVVGFHIGRRRWRAGYRVLDGKKLSQIRADGVAKGLV